MGLSSRRSHAAGTTAPSRRRAGVRPGPAATRLLVVWMLVATATVGLVSPSTAAADRGQFGQFGSRWSGRPPTPGSPARRRWSDATRSWSTRSRPRSCLLPFPDDFYTVHDGSSATGRRVDFPAGDMAANVGHTRIDPTAWNLQDGFSPGSPIVVHVQGIDLAPQRRRPHHQHRAPPPRTNAPIVLLDATTGRRVPYWAELDANDPTRQRAGPAHPPGRELRRRAPHHRGHAPAPGLQRHADPDHAGVPGLQAGWSRPPPPSRPGCPTWRPSSPSWRPTRDAATTCTWPGTSPWPAPRA